MSFTKNSAGSSTSETVSCNISPRRRNAKHQVTPLKVKSKASKCDQGLDVHTIYSSPDATNSRFNDIIKSPSGSLPFSQDSIPEVVWDYTSPKIARGVRRREVNITIDEFLKNMYRGQVPEGNRHAPHYIELLEKWMTTKHESVLEKKPQETKKRENGRQHSRQFIEEMKQFLETIENDKGNTENVDVSSQGENKERNVADGLSKKLTMDEESIIWGDDEFDSTDELWGDITDDSFIVKATQEIESCHSGKPSETDSASPNATLVYSIPETLTPTSSSDSKFSSVAKIQASTGNSNINTCNTDESNLKDFTWVEDSGDFDWDDEFLIDDDSLSSIPDDVLQGVTSNQPMIIKASDTDTLNENINLIQNTDSNSDEQLSMKFNEFEIFFADGFSQISVNHDANPQPELSCKSKKLLESNSEKNNCFEEHYDDDNSLELFNSSDDESILCKPEVLNWMDEVESQVSQNQKCTPDEIAQKKDEALKRRQRNLKKKSVSRQK